jgi:succinyl-CoA synthetase alpha subunit
MPKYEEMPPPGPPKKTAEQLQRVKMQQEAERRIAEEEAAAFIKTMTKPVIGLISGRTAPAGNRMGDAGAIISGGKGTADEKLSVMEECGIRTTKNPAEMGKLLKSVLK